MGRCFKTLEFVITIITWWVGVTKKWNCPLLFITNLWCSHFFLQKVNVSTSQTRKKSCLVFTTNACFFWTIVKQKNVLLSCTTRLLSWQEEKKTFDFVCLFFASFILVTWKRKQLWKNKKNALVFLLKASVLCFVFGNKQTLPWTKWAEFCK